MPSNAPLEPEVTAGTVLAGKYRIDEVIGRGGMGVVVAATHLGLEQRVALKFLLPAALGSVEATERFAREARAAVRLRSEHVARVLDVGQMDNGAPYIVMEFLEGIDLAQRIQAGPVGIGEAIDYVLQASEALAEAHALGIIHRDLKPRNLFLTRTVHGKPLVKVLDFGISKLIGPAAAVEELSLTRTSAIMGSPNYMSPEQLATPRNVDARSDVWSLGVILYELIAGRLPFQAGTITELCARVFQEEPDSLSALRPEVPLPLAHVVARTLAKKPEARWSNVQELARALAPFAPDPSLAQRVMSVSVDDRASVPGGARRSATFGDRPMPGSQPSLSGALSGPPSGPQLPAGTSVSWSDAGNAVSDPGAASMTGSTARQLPRTRHLAAIAVAAVFTTAGVAAALAIAATHRDASQAAATAATAATAAEPTASGAAIVPPNASGTVSAASIGTAIVVNAAASDAASAPPLAISPTTSASVAVAPTPTPTRPAAPSSPSTPRVAKPKPKPSEDNNLADDRH